MVEDNEKSSVGGAAPSLGSDSEGRTVNASASFAADDIAKEPTTAAPKRRRNPAVLGAIAVGCLLMTGVILAIAPRENKKLVETANTRIYICAETGKHFAHEFREGDSEPILSPFSGKKTAWIAETCFWTKDGKKKDTPTYVLLVERTGKPGPTICPDCGRVVVGHNPLPEPE